MPTLVGRLSDRTHTRPGARLPFLLLAAPPAALGLIAAPCAGSLLLIALAIAVFYIAYFLQITYMALYPDLRAARCVHPPAGETAGRPSACCASSLRCARRWAPTRCGRPR